MQSFAIRPYLTMVQHTSHELSAYPKASNIAAVKAVLSAQLGSKSTRHALPAAWYRAGTSKGLFFKQEHLPKDRSAWHSIILSAMGSKDGDMKQLNGMGGGTSTTSKVAVVAKSLRKGIDLEYTFIQIVPDGGRLDMTGNCGNIASGVAPFALDEGMITAPLGHASVQVRVLNTNTNKVMEVTLHLDAEGHVHESGPYMMPGLSSTGSPIQVSFLEPAGSMTRTMLPTGRPQDWIHVSTGSATFSVSATLIDVANPFVLVDATTLPEFYHVLGPQAPTSLQLVEEIRKAGAVLMGLANDTKHAALTRGTPKIAVVSQPEASADVQVTAFSAGRMHPSVQLTGAVCLAAAVTTPGTVVWRMAQKGASQDASDSGSECSSPASESSQDFNGSNSCTERCVRVQHATGVIEAAVQNSISPKDGANQIERVTITRTARRLFEGNVFYQA